MFAVDAELISHDPDEVEAYRTDPLVHQGKLPARTIAEMAAAIETFEQRMGNLTLPLLGIPRQAMTASSRSTPAAWSTSWPARRTRP